MPPWSRVNPTGCSVVGAGGGSGCGHRCHRDCPDNPSAANTAQHGLEGFEAGSSGLLPAVEVVAECGEGWGVGPVGDELTVGGEGGGGLAAREPDPRFPGGASGAVGGEAGERVGSVAAGAVGAEVLPAQGALFCWC